MISDAIDSQQWLGPKAFTRKMKHYEEKNMTGNNIIKKLNEGMVDERQRKKEKRNFNCTLNQPRPHKPSLLLSLFNSVQL